MKKISWIWATQALLFAGMAGAQMPMRDEGHHKSLLENEHIRLFDLIIPAGDTTAWHTHTAASVVVFLSPSIFAIQNQTGPAIVSQVNPGDMVYRAYDVSPVQHVVWGEDGLDFRCMVVEIVKSDPERDYSASLPGTGLQPALQHKLVDGYRIEVANGVQHPVQRSDCAHLLIGVTGSVEISASTGLTTLQEGGFAFFPPACDIRKISPRDGRALCIILEIK